MDLATSVEAQHSAPVEQQPSTVLDTNLGTGAAGGGAKLSDIASEEAPSLRDTISKLVKEGDAKPNEAASEEKTPPAKDEKTEAKEKPEAGEDADKLKAKEGEKPAKPRAEDGKFAKAQAEGEQPEGDAEQGETERQKADKADRRVIEAPKNFLPDAKEHWRNTPRTVQRDIEQMVRQHEEQVEQYREAHERYEAVRQYDEIARQHGGDLPTTLARVAQLEDMMQSNPVQALNQMLLQAGPRKADGQPYSLFEVASAIAQAGPEGYQRMMQQAAQQQPVQQSQQQPNPEVEQLKQQLAAMQAQTLEATVIAPFKAAHPRYDELKDDIAFFLQSGKIPASLSPQDRLEAAYDMAARINPASHVESEPQPKASPDPVSRVDTSNGSKSIRSTPGAVTPDLEPDRGGSIRDTLAAEMRRLKRS